GLLGRLPQLAQLSALDLCLLLPLRFLLGRDEQDVMLLRSGQVSLERVVVPLRNGIELVVVTARAADGQAKKCRSDDVGSFGQDFIAAEGDVRIPGIASNRAEPMKDRRRRSREVLRGRF